MRDITIYTLGLSIILEFVSKIIVYSFVFFPFLNVISKTIIETSMFHAI